MRKLYPAALAILALTALPAYGTTSYYSDESAFNGSASGLTFAQPSYDFSTYTPGALGMSILDVDGTGVDFLSSSGNLDINSGTRLTAPQGSTINMNLSSGILAFGFHFTVLSGSGTVCGNSAGPFSCDQTYFALAGTTYFFGAVGDSSILNTLSLQPLSSTQLIITDFVVGTAPLAAEAPEPMNLMMMGGGLVMISLLRRFRNRRR